MAAGARMTARMTARHNAVFPAFDLDHRGIRSILADRLDAVHRARVGNLALGGESKDFAVASLETEAVVAALVFVQFELSSHE